MGRAVNMTSVFGLDEIDLKILDILQHEGRISVLNLAERVGLSATPCGRRLKALEENGFIGSYVALLEPKKLGIGFNAFVKVRLNSSQRNVLEIFLDAVKKMPEVQEAYFIAGDYDYLLHIRSESADTFKLFLVENLLSLPLVHTQTYIVLEDVKHTTSLPLLQRNS